MKKIYKISALLTALVFTSGCNKYLDINSNPAVPQVVKAEILLPPMQFQMANGTGQDYERAVSKLTQNMAGVVNDDVAYIWERQGYVGSSDVSGVMWRMTYYDLGINLENMIKDAVANQKWEYAGIGYAMKAWAYQTTTDAYGPIVLDEAFTPNQLTFHYQDQPVVYQRVREWVDQAIRYFNMTDPSPSPAASLAVLATGDNIYRGDKTKWKKFCYGLLALQYGHLVNKPNFPTALADSVTKYADLSFTSVSDDATIYFTASNVADANPFGVLNAPKLNSGWLSATGSQASYYGRQTTTILKMLTGGIKGTATPSPTTSLDPRFSRFLTPGTTAATTSPIYVGVTPGLFTPTNVPPILGQLATGTTVGYNGKYMFTDRARYPIMTYAELQFIKAEAQFIKSGATVAYPTYTNAIRATFDFYNTYGRTQATPDLVIAAADITAYMTSSEVAQSAATLTKSDIMQQKYIALWGWGGIETWCDLRKYHYDPLIYPNFSLPTSPSALPLSATNGGKMSYRLRPRYNSEYVWNLAELAKFGGDLSNYNTQEMWFSLTTP
ncbi:MAG: SusD/RagB family nutrient-binding outer membrane lipoprotein [Mucilaginibacter sp.]|uniref:SusD/RagB family nutrient-binding outer membrane lipoprotein n=1 Tax=Mucilaginibacter sp. TaxID=1882438 RepID=UPI0032643118